ncbi:MAG: hypothetical protein U9Q71_08010 [Pseudomonadota bacterium]|nr:hypothetical protein [Pseudomonadota bacterium]
MRFAKWLAILLLPAGAALGLGWYFHYYAGPETAIKLDREEHSASGGLLNPSTQSINRYFSVLRGLDRVRVMLSPDGKTLSLAMGAVEGGEKLFIDNLDIRYLAPLLPYPHSRKPDEFDLANLMLAEYARNGVDLSYQASNRLLGVFHATPDLFNSDGEYLVESGGGIAPNPGVRPKRVSVTNNCLKPGLWEVAAGDSVGEMFHGWFDMPRKTYYEMVRLANDIEIPDWKLARALRYREDLGSVKLDLDRLRREGDLLLEETPRLVKEKRVGSYSSQDSRRKTQQGYFQVMRNSRPVAADSFNELREGDRFRMRKFVAPGLYSASKTEEIPYMPRWSRVEIRAVTPLTRYPGGKVNHGEQGHIEIRLHDGDGSQAIVMGNIPLALLVTQEDYRIPAFGVGVLAPSEAVERRYLRIEDGPAPHYAYQARREEEGGWTLVNNHATGFEQIYLRPVEREGKLYLRITLVSYERIVDLVELETALSGELEERVRAASSAYQPPLFRVYRDDNVL